jgi:hypothetical protein
MYLNKIPNGKQLVVYRVTTLLFPGKQPIACLKRETILSGSDIVDVENITDGRFVPYITGCVVNFINCQKFVNTHFV